ncbi:MAG: signal peptidase I, partial [Clostridia bacterium]|nr:signal peptidase I [Clostridia bacterium]
LVTFVTHRTLVHGSSMEPRFHDGDSIMTDKITYRFREPERFDIISFPYLQDQHEYLIKRIIGLPGETVRIINGSIYINDVILNENYGLEVIESGGIAEVPIVLGPDEYFVLGDNRNDSLDSRFKEVGMIQKEDIIGKAWLQVWPLNQFGLVHK